MDSDDIFNTLDDIARESSKTGKMKLLAEAMGNEYFRVFLKAALDPATVYGVGLKTLREIEKSPSGFGVFVFDEASNVMSNLARMADGSLSGGAAERALREMRALFSERSWNVIRLVLLKKLNCGVTVSSVNKIEPGFISIFACMLADSYDENRVSNWPAAVEPKLDGMRLICLLDLSGAEFFTRTGKKVETLVSLGKHLHETAHLVDYMLDGEVMAGAFAKTMSDVRGESKGDAGDAVFHVFDAMPLRQWEARESRKSYMERREDLESVVQPSDRIKIHPRYLARNDAEVRDYARKFMRDGLEGAIVKNRDAPYAWRRNFDWMKIKGEVSFDLPINGFFEGEGKYRGALGGLIVDFNGVDVRVGGGLTDLQRKKIWANRESYMGRLVEVAGHEVTPDGSIRHPRLVGLRWDKE